MTGYSYKYRVTLGWVDLDLGCSTVLIGQHRSCRTAQRPVEHPTSKSTQPRSASRWYTLSCTASWKLLCIIQSKASKPSLWYKSKLSCLLLNSSEMAGLQGVKLSRFIESMCLMVLSKNIHLKNLLCVKNFQSQHYVQHSRFGQYKSYRFDAATSCKDCSDEDEVTIINVALLSLIDMIKET